MMECWGIAGRWNSKRTKISDRVWTYTDFHPDHFETAKPKSGREVVHDVICLIASDGFTWAEGYNLSSF